MTDPVVVKCRWCGRGPLERDGPEQAAVNGIRWRWIPGRPLTDPWEDIVCTGTDGMVRSHEPAVSDEEVQTAIESIMRREDP